MAHRTATLYIRITKNGRSSFCKPVYQSKGRLKPQYAMVGGEPEHHKDGVYYVRFGTDGGKQHFVLVGTDPYVALDKLAEKQRWLRDRERLVISKTPVNSKPESSRLSIDDAVEQYFKNLHSQGKDAKTIRAYKVAVEEFRKSCTKKFLNEIGKQDLIDFMGFLRKQPPKLRKDGTPRKPRKSGDPNRTYFNKVNNVVIQQRGFPPTPARRLDAFTHLLGMSHQEHTSLDLPLGGIGDANGIRCAAVPKKELPVSSREGQKVYLCASDQ